MASGWSLISVGSLCGTSSIAHKKQVHDLLGGLCFKLSDSCDDDTFLRVVSKIKIARSGDEEVSDHLVVDFDVGDEDIILIVLVFVDLVENILDSQYAKYKWKKYLRP